MKTEKQYYPWAIERINQLEILLENINKQAIDRHEHLTKCGMDCQDAKKQAITETEYARNSIIHQICQMETIGFVGYIVSENNNPELLEGK